MFGHHQRQRERKKLRKEKEELSKQKKQWDAGTLQREKEAKDAQTQQAQESATKTAEERKKARQEGRQHVEELFNDPNISGLSPEKRNALQYEANKQVQRAHQSSSRKLLGDQASHGIVGKGGVGYAQQKDLAKMANEAQGQATRDLDKLNEDMRLKRIAAIFAGEQGEASQAQLDKQMALDELKYEEEKKRNRFWEDQFNRQFSRV